MGSKTNWDNSSKLQALSSEQHWVTRRSCILSHALSLFPPHLALCCLIVLLWVTEPHLRPCVKYWQIKAQRPFTQQRDVTREATILCLPPSVWQDLKYITYLRGRQRTFPLLPDTASLSLMLWQTSFQTQIQKQNTCQPFMFPGLFHIWFQRNSSRGDDYQSSERQIQSQTPSPPPTKKKKKKKKKPFHCLREEKGGILVNQLHVIKKREKKALSCTSSRNLRQGLIKPLPIHQGFNNEHLTYWFMHINELQHPLV